MSMSKERDQEIRGLLEGFTGRGEITIDRTLDAPHLLAIWDLLVELGAVREQLNAARGLLETGGGG